YAAGTIFEYPIPIQQGITGTGVAAGHSFLAVSYTMQATAMDAGSTMRIYVSPSHATPMGLGEIN
ncbi:MAG: hypothetical protein ACYTF7_11075, partial [Planctomycetota bacterium]